MRYAILIAALVLTACGKEPTHTSLLQKGCVFKERVTMGKSCNRYGSNCDDILGTRYSCPAYETNVAD